MRIRVAQTPSSNSVRETAEVDVPGSRPLIAVRDRGSPRWQSFMDLSIAVSHRLSTCASRHVRCMSKVSVAGLTSTSTVIIPIGGPSKISREISGSGS